jgi:hypothetical protein
MVMSTSRRFVISIAGLSAGESDAAADDLESRLKGLKEAEEVTRVRDSKSHQDFGVSIAIVLGAPAAVAIAKGIADWLRARENGEIIIKTPEGSIVARGHAAQKLDVAKVTAVLRGEGDEP